MTCNKITIPNAARAPCSLTDWTIHDKIILIIMWAIETDLLSSLTSSLSLFIIGNLTARRRRKKNGNKNSLWCGINSKPFFTCWFFLLSASSSLVCSISIYTNIHALNIAFDVFELTNLHCCSFDLAETETHTLGIFMASGKFDFLYIIIFNKFLLPSEKDFHDNEHEWASIIVLLFLHF